MKIRVYFLAFLLLFAPCFGAFHTTIYSQEKDVVLAKGNPPLTQLMAGKFIVLFDWALNLKLSALQESTIKQSLIRSWNTKNREEIDGALAVIEIYEKVFQMSEAERNNARGKLEELLLQSIRAEPDDELAQMLLSAYDVAHPANSKITSRSNSAPTTKSNMRVGGDGFTGVYRMLRPRALDINNSSFESGYYVEHITFLPSGHVYWTLPPEGLLYFDPVVAQRAYPDDWGTYELKNGEIHILRGPARQPYVITRSGERLNNPPSLGKGSFRRVPAADGLRLDGNYRRDPAEPTLSFTKDGRFVDGGVFRYFGDLASPDGRVYQDDGRGGSGTYLIEQNTLELRYSDGRIKRHPFTVFPENLARSPAIDSFILRAEESMKRH